jgi:acyl carrier protein
MQMARLTGARSRIWPGGSADVPGNGLIHASIIAALQRKLDHGVRADEIDDDSDLVNLGIVDSIGILDILLEVEATCGIEFDPERLVLEGGLTVSKLVAAFPADTQSGDV